MINFIFVFNGGEGKRFNSKTKFFSDFYLNCEKVNKLLTTVQPITSVKLIIELTFFVE